MPIRGVSIATLTNWVFVFGIGLLFPILVDVMSINILFFIFCGFTILGLFFCKYFMFETMGLTKEEIEKLFFKKERKQG